MVILLSLNCIVLICIVLLLLVLLKLLLLFLVILVSVVLSYGNRVAHHSPVGWPFGGLSFRRAAARGMGLPRGLPLGLKTGAGPA